MTTINPELIAVFGEKQPEIWGAATTAAAEVFGADLTMASPLVVAASSEDVQSEMTTPMLVVQFGFEDFQGHTQVLLFPAETAKKLISRATGSNIEEVTDEVANDASDKFAAVIKGLCDGMSSVAGEQLVAASPSVSYQLLSLPPNMEAETLLRTQISLTGDDLNGSATWLVDQSTARMILGPSVPAEVASSEEYEETSDTPKTALERELEVLFDVPLHLSVELGRVKMLVQDVLELTAGSVIELEKAAGEPVDVLVNGCLVARGEVVVIEDNFGVRLTEIVSPQERVQRLGEAA